MIMRNRSKSLDMPLHISTSLKDMLLCMLVCEMCEITLGEQDLEMDLVVIVMYNFDLIIRMN